MHCIEFKVFTNVYCQNQVALLSSEAGFKRQHLPVLLNINYLMKYSRELPSATTVPLKIDPHYSIFW